MEKKQHSYLKVFFLAFITFALIVTPVVIYNGGYMTYYGDFNSQQLPFIQHMYENVKNGDLLWDWGTDLGSSFIGSYSFYLLGSPFFWLMTLLPEGTVLYAIPWVLSLKYATAALTSYAYIRRFTKLDQSAVIGGFLYAFSGFQAYNIFFNHFHDVTALFPLMLIAMEEHMTKNRRGLFAICVALMACVNYFFFTGQAIFLILYFILRSGSKDFNATFKKFLTLALEAIIGSCMAAVILLPAALAVLNNYRVKEYLYGMDILAYSDRARVLRIIQSFFMIPDAPARPNLFENSYGKWSSIAGYLPMFSMIGVISYLRCRPERWSSRIIKFCIVFSFIPVLNSSFYMLNASYYARWFYMPILIMALVTAQVFERPDIHPVSGIRGCIYFFIAATIISIIPKKEDGNVEWFNFAGNMPVFFMFLGITILLFMAAVFIFVRKKKGKSFIKQGVALTIAASFISTASIFYYGIYEGPYPEKYLEATVEDMSFEPIDSDTEFFRTDISENCDNYAMFWGYSSMRCFQSTVTPSIMDFYESIGITRDVASRADHSYYALRGLLSVKYYFSNINSQGEETETPDMPGFVKMDESKKSFAVYENEYFVPMGFTYDTYMTKKQFESLGKKVRANALMHSILLDDEQIQKYDKILNLADASELASLTEETYINDCQEKASSACYEFNASTNGFTAKINTEKEELVFFSVPYDPGFTAQVNGQDVEIEKVNNGFMAVKVPAGESTITFNFMTYGLQTGIKISIISIIMLVIYLIASLFTARAERVSAISLRKFTNEILPDENTTSAIINKDNVIDIQLYTEDEE